MDLQNWLGALIGGGLLALVGTMLTLRDGRQRRYDERTDADNARLREENKALDIDNDRLRDDVARYRRVLIEHGIDPDTKAARP